MKFWAEAFRYFVFKVIWSDRECEEYCKLISHERYVDHKTVLYSFITPQLQKADYASSSSWRGGDMDAQVCDMQ